MKYIKMAALLLVVTAILGSTGVSAATVGIYKLTIPALNQQTATGAHNKDNTSIQHAMKESCTDNVSGNEMAVQAKVYSVNYNRYTEGWTNLPKGQKVALTQSNTIFSTFGTFKLNLRAENTFVTTGTFNGAWYLD